MIKKYKTPLIVVGVVLLLVVIILGVWLWITRQAFPKTSGKIKLEGLSQSVEIVRDEYGVSHIYAQTPEDLFFAEGYVHAQERFWQMEFQRRTGAGRLSEIFGSTTLSTDRWLRHYGFYQLAQKSFDMMNENTRAVLEAYSAGVNAYIQDRSPGRLGLEFTLLNLQGVKWEIEPWQPADSIVWAYMMVYDQGGKPPGDLINMNKLAVLGETMYADLNPPYREDRPTIIQPEDFNVKTTPATGTILDALSPSAVRYALGFGTQSTVAPDGLLADWGYQLAGGSNSFVVSGEKTTTGSPLLANDPHMSIGAPSLWYEVGMHCPDKSESCNYNFRGFSLPGVPGILIGHNARIAWGLTNASFDAEDVFIERINPSNPNQYQVNGEWVNMDLRYEEIKVRGRDESDVLVVRSTRNGIVVSDSMISDHPFGFTDEGPDLYAVSFSWTGLDPILSVQAVLNVLQAQNWNDFVTALEDFHAGKQNWLYADVDGNIGYVLPGRIPIRAGGDGTFPVPGWNDDYIWTGFIPYDEMPRVLNPKQGYIVTANNPQVRQEDYPYLLSMDYDYGQRAERITDLIENDTNGISVEDMQAIQTDNVSVAALEIIPYLEDLSFEDERLRLARNALLAWDGDNTMDSPEAALFNYFMVELIAGIFYDQLPASYYPGMSTGTFDTIYWLLKDPGNPWWDDARTPLRVEDRFSVMSTAFEKAYAKGVAEFGENLADWRWGDIHTITYKNATLGRSGIGFIENLFNRGPFPTSGSESVPQKTCWSTNNPFEVICIPALRQVINLGELSDSWMVHNLGQSGHPMNTHYDDFIDLWRNLQYHPSNWDRQDAEAGEHDLLLLEPDR